MFRYWKLQNQVLCVLLQMIFVMACVTISYIMAYSSVEQVDTSVSEFLMVQVNNGSSSRSYGHKKYQLNFEQSLRQIVNNNYLYQYTEELDYQHIQSAKACINRYSEQDAYAFDNSVCYGFFGDIKCQFRTLERSKSEQLSFNQMFKAWKLQNYVLCLLFFSSIFVMTCMTIVGAVAYQQVEEIFTTGSELLIVRENNRSSTKQQYLTIRNISLILNRSLRQLVNNNYIYQYSQQVDYQYILPPRACMNNQSDLDKYAFNSSVCYGFYGNQSLQISEQDKELLNFTALLSMTLLIQDEDSFYFASTSKQKLLARHQGQYLLGFDPQTRPWYVTFMNYTGTSLTTFTTPYYSLSNLNYLISQSTGLRNLGGSIAGVMAGQLIVVDLMKSQQHNLNITMFDGSGLVYNVGLQNSTLIYLHNESYTGFNKQQSKEILQSINSTETFLLFNSLYQQDIQVKARKLYHTGLFLLFQSNPTYQKRSVDSLITFIKDSLIELYIQTTLIFIFGALFIIIVSIVTMILNFRCLQNIELLMQNTYKSNSFKTLKPIKQQETPRYSSQLQILQDSFSTMVQNITECKSINQEALQINNQIEYLIKQQQSDLSQYLIRYLKSHIVLYALMFRQIQYQEPPFRDEF